MNNEKRDNSELKDILEAISLLRKDVKETNREISRLEKRLAVSFPAYREFKSSPPKTFDLNPNRENLLKIYETLVAITKEKGEIGFSQVIKEYDDATIRALALEKGVLGSNKKIGVDKAKDGIYKQVQQSIKISQPINVNDN